MTFEIYTDRSGEYRWRLRARNGELMAVSEEGFNTKRSCLRSVQRIKDDAGDANIEELD